MNFIYAFDSFGVPRVEVYIFGTNDTSAKTIFDQLLAEKDEIERRFGGPLGWERLDTKIACRIRFDLMNRSFSDEEAWPELQEEMIDAMVRLEKAMRPSLKKLPV